MFTYFYVILYIIIRLKYILKYKQCGEEDSTPLQILIDIFIKTYGIGLIR